MNSDDEDLSNLLDELDDSYADLPTTTAAALPDEPVEEINDGNVDDIIYKSLAKMLQTSAMVSGELAQKIKSGDTYESTLMGFNGTITNLNGIVSKMDGRAARRDKMQHDKEMQKIKSADKLIEIEHRESKKVAKVDNATQNNYFLGGRSEFMEAFQELETPKIATKVIDVTDD